MKGESKSAQRAEVCVALALLTREEKKVASAQIVARLNAVERWRSAQSVALFAPGGMEPNVGWPEGKALIAFPRIIESPPYIELRQVTDPASLIKMRRPEGWKVTEPPLENPFVSPGEIEVILVPGLAFDRRGTRLGHGGGWFDRLLSQLPQSTLKIGLFFAAQELAEIEREPHDVPLDLVLTETETIEF